jgi:hypothetical protein
MRKGIGDGKMLIISHRGFWLQNAEKNTLAAFERSFQLGYGTETDVRDFNGQLVISHDIATSDCITLKRFFDILNENASEALTIALNIKADGLYEKLSSQIKDRCFKLKHKFFVFDMSIPDMKLYINGGDIPVFTRMSEIEKNPAWIEESRGIWLDSFGDEWYDSELVNKLILAGKDVCIVSPELHKRNYEKHWNEISKISNTGNLILCTDLPTKAQDFFKEIK